MGTAITTEVENIANAVEACGDLAKRHRLSAQKVLALVFAVSTLLIAVALLGFILPAVGGFGRELKANIPDTLTYAFLAIYVLTFSVLMAVYRMHIREATRFEHSQVAFMRIRVAGSNNTAGYQSEVRTALTSGAFDFPDEKAMAGRLKSPVPGYPGSDFGTAVLNKVLDGIDIARKPARVAKKSTPRDAA